MTFQMSRKKNMVLLIVMIALLLGSIYILLFWRQGNLHLRGGFALCTIFAITMVQQTATNFQSTVTITEKRVESNCRGKEIELYWNEITKIEYRSVPLIPIFDHIIVHSARAQISIEYNFENYLESWKLLKSYAAQHPRIIIKSWRRD